MSIATIITRGYGTFGDIGHVVTRGYEQSQPTKALSQLAVLYGADATPAALCGADTSDAILYGADPTPIVLEQG